MKKTHILFLALTALVLFAAGCDSASVSITDPAVVPAAQPMEQQPAEPSAEILVAVPAEPAAAEPLAAVPAPEQPAAVPQTDIGEEAAKQIAFEQAGLTDAEIAALTHLVVRQDRENGETVYEVDFVLGTTEYDFEIDRATGDVVSWDWDIEGYTAPAAKPDAAPSGTSIGEEQAVSIALSRVSGASASDVRIHSEHDDGKQVYEGRVVYGGVEYEFEIDAETGAVREWSSEPYEPYDDDRYEDDHDDDRYDDDWDDDDD